jgi:hypothetical protein
MGEQPGTEERLPLSEAEEMVDTLVGRVTAFTKRALALAREEAEDIWNEAHELRRGSQTS